MNSDEYQPEHAPDQSHELNRVHAPDRNGTGGATSTRAATWTASATSFSEPRCATTTAASSVWRSARQGCRRTARRSRKSGSTTWRALSAARWNPSPDGSAPRPPSVAHSFERVGRELAETARSLEQRISHLDEQTANDLRDLRQRMLDQSKTLERRTQGQARAGESRAGRRVPANPRRHDRSRIARPRCSARWPCASRASSASPGGT